MASIHCPSCGAPIRTLSSRICDDDDRSLEVTFETTCDCWKKVNSKIDRIAPTAVPESTPMPQHRTQQF